MKFTAAAIAALTLASTQSLAAPTPREAPESSKDQGSLLDIDVEVELGLLKKKRSDGNLGSGNSPPVGARLQVGGNKSIIQQAEPEHQTRPRATGTDAIRRGIALTPDSFHTAIRHRRQASAPAVKPAPGLVGSLGLAGALGGLGLGGLLPGVESAVDGIPIVGAPVAGVLTGADNAVGVTALLSPKDDPTAANATVSASGDSAAVAASANAKRQAPSDGLVGTLGLDGALGALGLGGLLGTVEQTVDGLPAVGPIVGGLLGSVDGAVGLTALLSPAGGAAKRDVSSSVVEPTVPLSTLLGLIGQLQQAAASSPAGQVAAQAEALTGSAAKTATGAVSSSPLGGMSIAQAEALGLLPAGFANSLLVNIKKTAKASASASLSHGNILKAKGANELDEEQGEAAASATPTATSTSSIAAPAATESAVVNQAKVKAATLSTSAAADVDSGSDGADSDSELDSDDDDTDDDEIASALVTAAAQPTPKAAVARGLDARADSDDAAPAYTAMSSSTMAPTPSQAEATASAMTLEPSDEGETAVPNSTAAVRARSLD